MAPPAARNFALSDLPEVGDSVCTERQSSRFEYILLLRLPAYRGTHQRFPISESTSPNRSVASQSASRRVLFAKSNRPSFILTVPVDCTRQNPPCCHDGMMTCGNGDDASSVRVIGGDDNDKDCDRTCFGLCKLCKQCRIVPKIRVT